ncbi:MAG: serine hydrolase domain-containing protein [Nitrospiraceae bacterium]
MGQTNSSWPTQIAGFFVSDIAWSNVPMAFVINVRISVLVVTLAPWLSGRLSSVAAAEPVIRRSSLESLTKLLQLLLIFLPAVLVAACQETAPPVDVSGAACVERLEGGLFEGVVSVGHRIEAYILAQRMVDHDVPGVSIAVINDDEVEWTKGYGVADVKSGAPVTSSTLFQAASISKPVTAMAALKFVEDGFLDFDEDVNIKLTSWKVPSNELTKQAPVTLRGILGHTAGLTVSGFPGYARGAKLPKLTEVLSGGGLANTGAIRVETRPGSLWRYSGGGYTVLQQLLVDVAGKPFPEIMAETVLRPLGMLESTFEQPLPKPRHRTAASGHNSSGKKVEGDWYVYPEMAAAGLWTTPTDLARFALEVQRSLRGEANYILSPELTRRMIDPGLGDWGLGFLVERNGARFSHQGANRGFRASLVALTEHGKGAVIMMNSERGSPIAQEILLMIAQACGWPEQVERGSGLES